MWLTVALRNDLMGVRLSAICCDSFQSVCSKHKNQYCQIKTKPVRLLDCLTITYDCKTACNYCGRLCRTMADGRCCVNFVRVLVVIFNTIFAVSCKISMFIAAECNAKTYRLLYVFEGLAGNKIDEVWQQISRRGVVGTGRNFADI